MKKILAFVLSFAFLAAMSAPVFAQSPFDAEGLASISHHHGPCGPYGPRGGHGC